MHIKKMKANIVKKSNDEYEGTHRKKEMNEADENNEKFVEKTIRMQE